MIVSIKEILKGIARANSNHGKYPDFNKLNRSIDVNSRQKGYDSSLVTESVKKDLYQEMEERKTKFHTSSRRIVPMYLYWEDDSYDAWREE